MVNMLRKHRLDLLFITAVMAGAVALSTMIGGCSLYPKKADPLCAKAEYAGSVICAIGEAVDVQPEQMDDMLLDASLFPVALKQANAQQMRDVIAKVRKWVVEKDILTMQGISAYLTEQSKIDPVLVLLLSRRLPMFANVPVLSAKPFLPIDKQMVIDHLDHQADQFNLIAAKMHHIELIAMHQYLARRLEKTYDQRDAEAILKEMDDLNVKIMMAGRSLFAGG